MPADPALLPPVIIASPGNDYADNHRHFQGIPGMERAPKGRLWAAWYSGGVWEDAGNYVVLVTSVDDGFTWSKPALIVAPPSDQTRTFDPCLWLDPQGRLWLFWSQSLGAIDGRFGVWTMCADDPDEECPAWSQPRRIGDGIMMNKPTVTKAGDWLLPVSIWAPSREGPHAPPAWFRMESTTGAYAVISRDHGKSFEYLGRATGQQDRTFDEHMLVERDGGGLWMLSRTRFGIWENSSADAGKTWDEGHFSSIPHVNSRFFIRRLASGDLLLVRHNPPDLSSDKTTRSHLTVFISKDDGSTWQGGLLLDEREGVSYPDGVQAPDGTIYIIYDFNRTKDKQILMATFTAGDVEAAQWLSPKARQRIMVNQATGSGKIS